MSIQIDPKQLKITLDTNIPIGNNYEKDILTFGTLISDKLKEVRITPTQYPYFTYQVKYDESVLGFYAYDEVVKTFFKKELFLNRLCNSSDIIKAEENESDPNVLKKRRENMDNNVMLMLKYLLPTKWPVVNNHFSSYDMFKMKDPMNTLFFNPFLTRNYVNLKLSSGAYSLKKVVWLNDIINLVDINTLENINTLAANYSNNDLIKNRDTHDELMGKIKECYEKKCDISELTYLGMLIRSDPYEIVVDVELFEGEMKDGDEKDVKCPYYSDYLGEQLKEIMRPNRNPVRGKLPKKPLFSITSKISKKKGFVEKEELDEKTKAKRKDEDAEYIEVDEGERKKYELYSKKFFEEERQGKLQAKLKKYDINPKGFFIYLSEDLTPIIKYINSEQRENPGKDDKPKTTETLEDFNIKEKLEFPNFSINSNQRPETTKPLNIDEFVEKKIAQYSERKKTDRSFKERFEEEKFKLTLAKKFVYSIASQAKAQSPPPPKNIGGKTQKRRRIKKRYTRRRY
uniref:Uncharacterized protein n=1 Tax=viral metagenome TaxID=1070528 RepID=A0A6C0L9H2_9ZZZZ